MVSNGKVPELRPGILLLPPGPNGEKYGVDDWGAKHGWDIEDFNAYIHPLHDVFDEHGEYVAVKNGIVPPPKFDDHHVNGVSENDDHKFDTNASDRLPVLTVAEFLTAEPISYDWIAEGIVAKGALTKLAGKNKESGKTTFLMCLCADVLNGTDFLGRPTKKVKILYLSEQASTLREALKDAGIDDSNVEGLMLLPAHSVMHMDWGEITRLVHSYCTQEDIGLLIVDTLVDFSDVEDSEENSSGKVKGTIKPLKNLVQAHKIGAVFTQHHNLEDRGRGSTQFDAETDINADLFAPNQVAGDLDDNMRMLTVIGRGVAEKRLVKFIREEGYVSCGKDEEAHTTQSRKAKTVLRFLPALESEARSIKDLMNALEGAEKKMSRATVERSADELVQEGLAHKKGEGTRTEPRRYWRAEPVRTKTDGNEVVTADTNLCSSFSGTPCGDDDHKFEIDDTKENGDNVVPIRPGIEVKTGEESSLAERFPTYVDTAERLDACFEWTKRCAYVSIDIETKGKNKAESTLYTKATIRLVVLNHGDETWYLDCDHLDDVYVTVLLKQLEDKPKYFHNSAFDVPRIHRRFGVLLNKNVKDTLIVSRAARAGEWEEVYDGNKTKRPNKGKELQDCIERELGTTVPKNKKYQKGSAWFDELTDDHLVYAGDDVKHLKALYEKLVERIEALNIKTAYDAVESVVHVFLEAAVSGIPFDARALEAIQAEVAKERDECEGVLRSLAEEHAPHPEGLKWVWRNTNKDTSADGPGRAGVHRLLSLVGVKLGDLEEQTLLDNMDKHPIIKALYDYRVAANKYSKYARMLTNFYENNRVYPQVKIAGAVTGRVLYSDPNIQGFDKKKTDRYRKCIKAEEGYAIVRGDFAQQELRIAAWWSEDEDLLAAFSNNEDVYMKVAQKIVDKPVERGTEEGDIARAAAKRAVLGYLYGLGIDKYRQYAYKDTGVEISEYEAERDRDAFRAAYPGFYRWQKKYGARKDETNLPKPDMWETRSVKGWRRVVAGQYERKSEWKKKNNVPVEWIPKYTERLNGPIQSTAGDILYLALGKIATDLESGLYPGTRFLFTAHDEVVLQCPEKDAQAVALWLKSKMVEAFEEVLGPELGGPKSVEVSFGPSWGEIEEVA